MLWRRLDHQNVARVLGITMDPYRIVFDLVSDKDIVKYITTEEGVNFVVLVSLLTIPMLVRPQSGLNYTSSFRMSLKVLAIYILRMSCTEDSEV